MEEERSLEAYYKEVERYPLLTRQDEQALAARIERGDEKAVEALVQANLRFVIHVIKNFRNQGLSLSDLINEGNMGLLTAARKFDRRKGCKFITYAVWWIRQNVLKALQMQTRTVRIPANVLLDQGRMRRAETDLRKRLSREPTTDEIAEQGCLSREKVDRTLRALANTVSLDATLDDGDTRFGESLPDTTVTAPDECYFQKAMTSALDTALGTLSERHRQVLNLCFGMDGGTPATYQQIGNHMGISRERVRQLKEDALNKLRQPAVSKRLADYCA
jgi:RNA polymerase primary sigma factor